MGAMKCYERAEPFQADYPDVVERPVGACGSSIEKEYIKLFWESAPEGEPTIILYEVDTANERLAHRSIDIFADGHTRNIPDLYDGAIEITPFPTVEELNASVWGGEFHACIIEKTEFEAIWESHTYDGALK